MTYSISFPSYTDGHLVVPNGSAAKGSATFDGILRYFLLRQCVEGELGRLSVDRSIQSSMVVNKATYVTTQWLANLTAHGYLLVPNVLAAKDSAVFDGLLGYFLLR